MHFHQVAIALQLHHARGIHVARYRYRLAAEIVHLHGDLRILEILLVSGDQVGLQLLHRQAGGMHLPDHGQGHRSIVVDLRRLVGNVVGGKYPNRDRDLRHPVHSWSDTGVVAGGWQQWARVRCRERLQERVMRSSDTTVAQLTTLWARTGSSIMPGKQRENRINLAGDLCINSLTMGSWNLAEKYLRRGRAPKKSA